MFVVAIFLIEVGDMHADHDAGFGVISQRHHRGGPDEVFVFGSSARVGVEVEHGAYNEPRSDHAASNHARRDNRLSARPRWRVARG